LSAQFFIRAVLFLSTRCFSYPRIFLSSCCTFFFSKYGDHT